MDISLTRTSNLPFRDIAIGPTQQSRSSDQHQSTDNDANVLETRQIFTTDADSRGKLTEDLSFINGPPYSLATDTQGPNPLPPFPKFPEMH